MQLSDIFDEEGEKDTAKQRKYLEKLLSDKYGIESEEELDRALEEEKTA